MSEHHEHSPTFYFHHIPKTAGMTFYNVLKQFFSAEETCPAWLWEQLLSNSSDQARSYRLYRGHFFGYLESFLERKLTTLALIRDPVKRTVSHYKHVARHAHPLHEKVASQTLLEFVQDPETRPMCENLQTNYLITRGVEPSSLATARQSRGSTIGLRILREHWADRSVPDRSRLREAKARLERFAWFGIVERFDDSMTLLSSTLGWPTVGPEERRNVAPVDSTEEQLDQETASAIREATSLDRELYEDALVVFERRLGAASDS